MFTVSRLVEPNHAPLWSMVMHRHRRVGSYSSDHAASEGRASPMYTRETVLLAVEAEGRRLVLLDGSVLAVISHAAVAAVANWSESAILDIREAPDAEPPVLRVRNVHTHEEIDAAWSVAGA